MMGGMGTSGDAADALAAQGHAPYLPEPTGPCPVGTRSLWLTDTSRPDPWAAEVTARELMVSLWYPAATPDGRRAQYMTPAESELQLTSGGITGVPPDMLSTVRTNAADGAEPAGHQHGLPLVVLSPGFTNPRSTLTAMAEDLASHGYVVAGIDHTYESYATAFPDAGHDVPGPRGTPARILGKGKGSGEPGSRCYLRARRTDRREPGLAGRRADRPVADGDGWSLPRRCRRHRRHAGRLPHPRRH